MIYTEAQGLGENLRSLAVPQGVEVEYIPISAGENLLAAYQAAMEASDAKYKVYANGNSRIVDLEILSHIVESFQVHPEIGILGLSGARQLSTNGISYVSEQRAGRIMDPEGQQLVFSQTEQSVERVEAIDGCFLATQYDVPWRSDLLHDSLFLGASASCEHRRVGHAVAVLTQTKAACQLVENRFAIDRDDQNAFLDEYSKELYPLVSICIPTYQRPDYFREALESVIHQTYRNLDIFITDNSHNEDTKNLMEAYVADGRISYYHHPQYGKQENWNEIYIYDHPKADYVGWLMDDDLFLPDKISFMVEAYRNHPDVSLVTSYRYVIDGNGKRIPDFKITKPLSTENIIIPGAQMGKMMLENLVNFIGEPSTTLMCKKYIKNQQYRWTDIDFAYDIVDIPIWLNLLSQGNLFYFAEPLSCFRLHGGNDQAQFSTLVGGTICWSRMVDKAWKEKIFLENQHDLYLSLKAIVRMGLHYCKEDEVAELSIKEQKDFEDVMGRAFLGLSKLADEKDRRIEE